MTMQSPDGQPLQTALPGQYVVLRLQLTTGSSPLFRSYSLSGPLPTERYRISVKIEPNGPPGTWLRDHVRVGNTLDVSSPRGNFILQVGERTVVLLSAGIGATPVLAMLHSLVAPRSTRQILWLHAARDRKHHPFATEVRGLMLNLPRGRSYVCYSKPGALDKPRKDFDVTGHFSRVIFDKASVPREADVYLCGPTRFMTDMKAALAAFGIAPERVRIEIFNGSEPMTPGVVSAGTRIPHLPQDEATTGRWSLSRVAASPRTGMGPLIRASWNWPKYATFRFVGRAVPVYVIAVRAA